MNFTTAFPNTSSSNRTVNPSGCSITIDSYTAKVMKSIALSTILICALIANSLVIAVFVKIRSLHKGINFFLVNMAVSDLIIPIVFVPKEIYDMLTASTVWRVDGDFGLALCKLYPFILDACFLVSVLSLVWITVDRFRAVVMPLKFNAFDGWRSVIIASIWISASIVYTPYFYSQKLFQHPQGYRICYTDWSPLDHVDTTTAFVVVTIVAFGIIPLLLFAALYFLIIRELRKSRARVSTFNTAPLRLVQDHSLSVLKQALAVTGAFSLCHLPMVAFYLIVAFVNKFMCPTLPYWGHFFFTARALLLSNTFINPCICLFLNENYRSGLRSVVGCRMSARIGPSSIEMGRTRARASTIDTLQTA